MCWTGTACSTCRQPSGCTGVPAGLALLLHCCMYRQSATCTPEASRVACQLQLHIRNTCTASQLQQATGVFCRERFVACPEMLETDGRQAEADLFNLEDPFWISVVDQCHFRYAQPTHMPIIWHKQDLHT